ncbi:MAG: acyl carrier protein phosphodiesterase [Patiriisocius sp.]|jgi:acyl carrier protein phosphodiesterase
MNYLAHLHLSGTDEDLILGNFVADGMKNTPMNYFSEGVQKGILLHREIDEFTDSNLIFRRTKSRLFKRHRHYAAVLVDMFYDHFLAANWSDFSDVPLEDFTTKIYKVLEKRRDELPPQAGRFLSYIISRDTLTNYRNLDEFEIVLKHLSTRTKYSSQLETAIFDLRQDYDAYESDFLSFYPNLQENIGKYLIDKD